MTHELRFERQVTQTLEELYLGSTPDYRDAVLSVAVHRRQRPSWTFPGRWLPMLEIAVRPVAPPRLPLRALGMALLILALLVAALAYALNDQDSRLIRYFTDGSAAQVLLEGAAMDPEAFRPPDGAQICTSASTTHVACT
jgi:hypothetical protein